MAPDPGAAPPARPPGFCSLSWAVAMCSSRAGGFHLSGSQACCLMVTPGSPEQEQLWKVPMEVVCGWAVGETEAGGFWGRVWVCLHPRLPTQCQR